MRALRERVGHLTVVTANKNFFTRVAFVGFIQVATIEHEYAEHEPGSWGPGTVTIRATTRERFNAKKAELRGDGWTLLEC